MYRGTFWYREVVFAAHWDGSFAISRLARESRKLTASREEENGRRLALYRHKETKRSGSGRYLSIARRDRDGDARRRRRQRATCHQKLRKHIIAVGQQFLNYSGSCLCKPIFFSLYHSSLNAENRKNEGQTQGYNSSDVIYSFKFYHAKLTFRRNLSDFNT